MNDKINDVVPCFFLDNKIGKFNINDKDKLKKFSLLEISQMIKSVKEIRDFVDKG